ncbi:hypothetical protein [Glycomyces tritici]|uniref:Uncharacterized protein n=1 Tax=Glycomyces tritici TaxID=2665176 RepID=A0ABT7YX22_9ACTN|nr:hypothetical protein [Glycomyces tritici]MDN3242763.1 hypothetical protein [Glycomyces tritici]
MPARTSTAPLEVQHTLSTFVKGLAWTVALLSGIATIFALFGGQQWLEQQGWTLAPSATPNVEVVEQTTSATPDAPTDDPAETEAAESDSENQGSPAPTTADSALASAWAAVNAWSERTFDNLLWGIVAIGVSMLVAGAAGALFAAAQYAISGLAAFFQRVFGVVLLAVVVAMAFLLLGAESGYLVWFLVLTGISVPLGYFVSDEFG